MVSFNTDYNEILTLMNKRWAAKPVLRALYHRWFTRIVAELSPVLPVIEIGSGCGNFKDFLPTAIATDVVQFNQGVDCFADARQMPFGAGMVGTFVLVDSLHHLPRPLKFLRDATRCLRPGGRIVLFEPAATPWARLVWKLFHFEIVDLSADVFGEDSTAEPLNTDFMFANMGIATLLFGHNLNRTMDSLGGLKLIKLEYSDFLVYPATGGYSGASLIPRRLLRTLHVLERFLTRPFDAWLTGMRMLIVLERTETTLARV